MFFEITHPESSNLTPLVLQSLLNSHKRLTQFYKKYIRLDGKPIFARVTAWLVTDETGKPRAFRGLFEPYHPTLDTTPIGRPIIIQTN